MSQGKPGCEMNYFADLKTLVESKIIRLLVPEVVLLELEKQQRLSTKHFESEFGELKKNISLTKTWSEIEDVKGHLKAIAEQKKEERIKDWESRYSTIRTFLKSDYTDIILFTPDILCRGQRRLMAGKMKISNERSSQDAFLIESLVFYFEKCTDKDVAFLFCSENHSDFAEELKAETKNRIFRLHPLIQEGLPNTQYFIDLESMMKFAKGYEELPIPVDKDIEQAKRNHDVLGDTKPDSEEYYEALNILEKLIYEKSSKQFEKDFLPSLSDEIKQKRRELSSVAQKLLEECRECKSWNDRSELKLYSRLENVPEDMIPYTSLSNLVLITKNLREYLEIHQKLETEEKY